MTLDFKRIALAPDYVAGSDGRIVKVRGRGAEERDKVMRVHDNGRGYMKVKLTVGGMRIMFYVHRLVCEAFHGLPPDYESDPANVRHLNGDPGDNRADNLRWGTVEENMRDRERYARG